MKKIRIILPIILITIGIFVILTANYKPISTAITTKFWKGVFEIRQDTKYGSVGRDTLYTLGNGKFQIGKFSDDKVFFMYDENQVIQSLLYGVSEYQKHRGNLYVISNEGYGIVNAKTNQCRLYITLPADQFVKGYGVDSEGVQRPISRFVNDEHVAYLESFESFSEEEKKFLERMKKN